MTTQRMHMNVICLGTGAVLQREPWQVSELPTFRVGFYSTESSLDLAVELELNDRFIASFPIGVYVKPWPGPRCWRLDIEYELSPALEAPLIEGIRIARRELAGLPIPCPACDGKGRAALPPHWQSESCKPCFGTGVKQ